MGRTTLKTPEMMEEILELIVSGHNISSICSKRGMPGRRTVQRWLMEDRAFYKAYKKAVSLRAHETLLDVFAIADRPKANIAEVAADRLRVNARLRVASMLNPTLKGRRRQKKRKAKDEEEDTPRELHIVTVRSREHLRALEAKKRAAELCYELANFKRLPYVASARFIPNRAQAHEV